MKVISITLHWHFWYLAPTFIESDSGWQTGGKNVFTKNNISYKCARGRAALIIFLWLGFIFVAAIELFSKLNNRLQLYTSKKHIPLNANVVKTNQELTRGYECNYLSLKAIRGMIGVLVIKNVFWKAELLCKYCFFDSTVWDLNKKKCLYDENENLQCDRVPFQHFELHVRTFTLTNMNINSWTEWRQGDSTNVKTLTLILNYWRHWADDGENKHN